MLSCQQTQNVIDGKKRIILNPSEGQKRDFEAATFAEGEVYGIDVLISSGEDGKVCFFLVSTEMLSTHVNFLPHLGTYGRIANHDLSARFRRDLPTQNEKLPCRLLGGTEESRCIPVQHPLVGRREAVAYGSPRGCPA